jgi:DNA-binding LacI/PurR family transcriptional regulator
MALGFLHAMRQRGVEVPRQLSVIGFDDLEESQYAYPPLTTVRQDFRALGERAMQLLLLEIKGTSYKKLDRLVPELVVRSSTARLTAL